MALIGSFTFSVAYSNLSPRFNLLNPAALETQVKVALVSALIQGAHTQMRRSQTGNESFFHRFCILVIPYMMIYASNRYFYSMPSKVNFLNTTILTTAHIGIGAFTAKYTSSLAAEIELDRIEEVPESFAKYVKESCDGVDTHKAYQKALRGLSLIQDLYQNKNTEQCKLEEKMSDACWGLMLCALEKNQSFVEGTFDLPDPAYRFFNFFRPILYRRSASHYKTRAIALENGPWEGYGHFGVDINRNGSNDLPAHKRAVLIGRIKTRDNSHRIYLKMESWGANLNLLSDSRALLNIEHLFFHSYEFFKCQCKNTMPQIFGDWVENDPSIRKEFMFRADRAKCINLQQKISKLANIKENFEIDEYGFQDAVPYFKAALNDPSVAQNSQLHENINEFIQDVENRYDNLTYRKGNEVSINDPLTSAKKI